MGRFREGKSLDYQGAEKKAMQLREHHKSMARMMVMGGARPGQLALAFNMSAAQISIITQSPMFKLEVERLRAMSEDACADVRNQLNGMIPLALVALEDDLSMEVEDDPRLRKIRQTAAFDILSRTGYEKKDGGPSVVVQNNTQINQMTEEQLREEVFKLAAQTIEGR